MCVSPPLRSRAGLGLALLATLGCTSEAPGQRATLRGSGAVALSCRSADQGIRPLAECTLAEGDTGSLAADDLHALVLNRQLGEVAVASIQRDRYLDTLPGVPGITHIPVGDVPVDIAVGRSGQFAYVLNVGSETVSFVDLEGLCEAGILPLEGRPAAMLLDPTGQLYVAYPDRAEIAVVDLDDCALSAGSCLPGDVADVVKSRPGADGRVGNQPPACANGRDDDGDGRVDAADAGCADDADEDEGDDPALGSRCGDGVDNDGDGLTDLADPGCARASDDTESDAFPPLGSETPPACFDGVDDDGDGRTDWPADPGCAAAGDTSEEPLATACDDGVDNDGQEGPDGEDPGCTSDEDESEAGCDDQARLVITRVGSDSPDGAPVTMTLSPDGRILFVGHADRSYVSVVDVASRQVVREIGVAPACSNDLDDDGDGAVDFPDDPQCSDPLDDDEVVSGVEPECGDGIDNDGDGLVDAADPGCESPSDPVELAAPLAAACHDGVDNDGDGFVDLQDPGCRHEDDLDERDPEEDPELKPACGDGIDNDGDGVADLDDTGCAAAGDETEADPPGLALSVNLPCADGAAGCVGPGDLRARTPGDDTPGGRLRSPDLDPCADGLDNDGDGLADYPDDPDCESPSDQDEFHAFAPPACADGVDNDGDGFVDAPDDPDCQAAGDTSEAATPPACADGIDNDGDGLVDAAEDPGCASDAGSAEDEEVFEGATDVGCPAPADSPARSGDTEDLDRRSLLWCPPRGDRSLDPPHCNDGRDNDRDGLIDNEDPGCASPWDGDEVGVGPRPPACEVPACGGFPGAIATGSRPPACADGIDNDGDGAADPRDEADQNQGLPRCVSDGDLDEAAPGGYRPLSADLIVDARVDRITRGTEVGVAALRVTPDGSALYVLDRAFGWLSVVDLDSGRLVDTRSQTPFHRGKGISIPGVPVGIDFACFGSGGAEECGSHSPDVVGFVTGTEGEVRVVRARRNGQGVHRAEDGRGQLRTVALPPRAFRADGGEARMLGDEPPDSVPFTGRVAATFAAEGAHGVVPASERGPRDPSGFDFGGRSVFDGVWRATWEGSLPGSVSDSGHLRTLDLDPTGIGDDAGPVVLDDASADFCDVGVRPGDRLIVLSEPDLETISEADRPGCERVFSSDAMAGREGPEWCVTDVRPHRLALRALPRQTPEEGVRRASGVCPLPAPGNILDPMPTGQPLGECFRDFIQYKVRVGDHFVVAHSGAATIDHNWVAAAGDCVVRPDAHPLRTGRAQLCDPSGTEPCRPFVNRALSTTFFTASDPEVSIERDMAVQITLASGVEPLGFGLGTLTTGVRVDPNTGRAYVSEAGFEDLWVVDSTRATRAFIVGR